jgi:hypothetical protein
MQTLEAIVDKAGNVRLLTEIRLPEERRALLTILDEEPKESPESKKANLLAVFEKIQKANLFKDIEDPTEWQKKLRDEWE